MIELLLVIALLGVIAAFTVPNLTGHMRRRSLLESADRLRSLIVMAHAQAMQDGVKYRIQFPGTPDPLDPNAQKEIDVPAETLQPEVQRQVAPLDKPDDFGGFDAMWKDYPVMQDGTRCVAVLGGRPNFDITAQSPIAGPSVSEGMTSFVPLNLNPDGTCDWVTFVLTDLPFGIQPEASDVGNILNVIVDGRTGQTWIQRALRVTEVEMMAERGASPILHMDLTKPDEITEQNILEVHMNASGATTGRRTSEGGQ